MSSRKEQKEQLRRERLERERAAAAAAARRRRAGLAVGGLLAVAAVAAIVVVVAAGGGDGTTSTGASAGEWPDASVPARQVEDLDAAARRAGCDLRKVKSEGAGHTEDRVTYETQPPNSGEHFPRPASDAAYLQAPKPYESLVHALEHGRVVLWFKPNAPADVRGAMKKIYDEDPALTVLTPNMRPMPYQVAATAWTRLLGCPTYNDRVPDALRAFRDAYRLKGPEYIPQPE